MSTLSLDRLNAASQVEFTELLDGIYEHTPWIARQAWARRPFATLAQLKHGLAEIVRGAGRDAQLALIRAHPELAGKAMVAQRLTTESAGEQGKAGLTECSPEEYARLQQLNADYQAKFGWPFILAVRGPRATGLNRSQIIAAFERRLAGHPDFEFAECLRNIHRIAEIRLNERFAQAPELGNQIWDWAERLALHTDPGYAPGQLTVTYLTEAHRACAAQLQSWMIECGFDEVAIDAVGNVVGVYHAQDAAAPRVLTGSHYDTVRNAGRYDGRLGIFVPMLCVRELKRSGRRLPFAIEVVGFAEEEGQRFKATFLGSSALAGQFDAAWLDQADADGTTMREAMRGAGLPGELAAIAALRRDPARYLGFIEIHIEQGPVLNALDLPLGIVTSINGSLRYSGEIIGMASHAGTTPMGSRRDAVTAAAELALVLEKRAAAAPHVVGTMGMLAVPNGSPNVVPGRCEFTLDIRAMQDEVRDACAADVLAALREICGRRGLEPRTELTMRAAAAPSDPAWQQRWEAAVQHTGLPLYRMPSGAGHDAMRLHEVMPQAMLFVRGENAGISHNPLESSTNDDMQLATEACMRLLLELQPTGTR